MPVIYEPKGRAKEYSLLAINIFTGCRHGCTYCYARKMAKQYGRNFETVLVRKNLMTQLAKDVAKYSGTDKRVLLCFMCDPYQNENLITREVIELLVLNNIPFQVLTKGGTRACRDFDLYGKNDAFASTLTFLDFNDSKKYEPDAAPPEDRFRAMIEAKANNIETWASLEPVIDWRQSIEIIDRTHEFCDLYKIGKMNHQRSDINWKRFAIEALVRCKKYGKPYYIKDDLKPFLKGIEFTNTDTRRVKKL